MQTYYIGIEAILPVQAESEINAYQAMIPLMPTDYKIRHRYALLLLNARDLERALAEFKQVLVMNRDYAEGHNSISIAYKMLQQDDMAIKHSLEAVKIEPALASAWNNLGNLYSAAGNPSDAMYAFRRACSLNPNDKTLRNNLLLNINYSPTANHKEVREEHEVWGSLNYNQHPTPPPFTNSREPNRVLKVGILSPDFKAHSTNAFLTPFLESMSATFNVTAYSVALRPDEVTEHYRKRVNTFKQVTEYSDDQIVNMIRGDQIDVLLDLSGHTSGNRLSVFAAKCAPIQIAQFGYPNTTGIKDFGYRITDMVSNPLNGNEPYTEELIRLPKVSWIYRPPEGIKIPKTRSPNKDAIVFGSLNNPAKHNEKVIKLWAKVLKAFSGSKLHLLSGTSKTYKSMVLGLMKEEGVTPNRIVFLQRMEQEKYFEALGEIDIALDPFPYNGGITSCDSLWMGATLITMVGDSYVSRQGTMILNAMQLPAWVVSSEKDYICTIETAMMEMGSYTDGRKWIRDALLQSPMCAEKQYADDWKVAVRDLWKDWCAKETTKQNAD